MAPPLCMARNFLHKSQQIRAVRCLSLQRHVTPHPTLSVSTPGPLKVPTPPQHTSVRTNTQHRVVLLPEYPGHTPQVNPILKSYKDGLPEFSEVTEAHCYYGLGQRLMEFESSVCRMEASIEAGEKEWEVLLKQMEVERLELENTWAIVSLLKITTDKLDMDRFMTLERRAERAFLTRYDSRTIHGFVTGDSVDAVGGEDKTVLDRFVTEYRNQGYELPEKKYLELNANWMKRLGEAQRDHRFKLTTSTQRFRHIIRDPAVVREFPVDMLRAMSVDSSQPAKGPWSVTLHPYVYRKFLEYCPDRRLRWNAYNAYTVRGSRSSDVYLNVAGHVKDIRQHRLDQALVLGYYNYAEMSMVTKMAASVENVQSMIASMLGVAKESQEQELASLQEYAESRGFEDKIKEFDVPFFRRKQSRTLFGIEDEAIRDYFPLPTVLKGIFDLLETNFDVQFEVVEPESGVLGSVWNPEVTLYRVKDGGKEVGHCYLDPYIRDDKAYQGGDKGWYIPIRPHSGVGASQAVGAVVMALGPPGYGKPSLLSVQEVEEVVRQFGKVVQHMLAARKWSETSGKTGLEWDCLNVVPDFLMQWLMVPQVMQGMSQHWSSGERLSGGQVTSLISARNHLAGYDLCNELYKAAFDIAFYTEDYENEQYADLASRLAPQYLVLEREKEDAFPMYFEEMLTGHWAAGYYSHTWSKMLAADLFSAYLEAGLENKEAVSKVSARFKSTFLTSGSAVPTAQLFREFRGRDPTPEALLISMGIRESIQPKNRGSKS
eukprot:GFUD01021214.1.p1 GENE.GFUD01021214.1~~GFUD01021214.1.p1  ORF type:complete len:771 (+),score=230.50 GFUD01021214.1:151-2463(+)